MLGPHVFTFGPTPHPQNIEPLSWNPIVSELGPIFGIVSLDFLQLTSLSSTAGEWKAALWKLVSLRASQNGPFEYAM